MATIELTLDGQPVQAREGETILELAERNGKRIPTLCHDPRLEPFSACFVCLVEIEGKPGFAPSCSTKAAPGMRIVTDGPEIRAARKLCLELLMSAHDADCVAPCRLQCPDNIDIQTYIAQIAAGEFAGALSTIKRTNPFPSVCGRVCPHTCELQCRRDRVDEPVAINLLKRYVADLDLRAERPHRPQVAPDSGKRVAVVGAGPAGLTAAYFLRQKGHAVRVFEMNAKAGGMLRYGIPRYRLPDDVLDREIDHILSLGVELRCDQKLGRDFQLADLRKQGHDAVLLGVGAWSSSRMRVDGEDMPGVMAGIDYLFQTASDRMPEVGKRVVVVGGGNTAIDAARTARRAGAEVTILYRRTRKEMPAEAFEVDEAEREGVEMHFLAAPVGLIGDGRVERVRAIRMELGEPDASGRRRPVPVEGSELEIEVDTVITAIGQKPDPTDWLTAGGPESTRWNTVQADELTYQTEVEWIFTAGDCLTGAATAIEAIAGGRKAAVSIDRYLRGLALLPIGKPFSDRIARLEDLDEYLLSRVERKARVKQRELPVERRLTNFDEVELGIDQAQALSESLRCLGCGCSSVDSCSLRAYSEEYGVDLERFEVDFQHRPPVADHPLIVYDPNKCILCGRCVRICLEQQGAGALGFVRRGFDTAVQPSLDRPLLETDCDACGQCVHTCPTGALEVKPSLPNPGPYQPERTPVVCGFCGVGCRLTLETVDGRFVQATSEPGAFHNRGNLCVDGSFGHRYLETLRRVRAPRVREGGAAREVGWAQALQAASAGLVRARERNGIAVLVNGPLTNEEAYLLGRLARGKLQARQIAFLDEGKDGFGPGRPAGVELADLAAADQIWVVGDDPFEAAPVLGVELHRAAANGAPLVVLGSGVGRLDARARCVLRLGRRSLVDWVEGLAALASRRQPDRLAEWALQAGVKPSVLARLLSGLREAKRPVVVCDDGLGPRAARALSKLLAAVKRPGRLLLIRRAGNGLGRRHMGLSPAWLPGARSAGDKGHRARVEALWGEALAAGGAPGSAEVLRAVGQGSVDAVMVVNTDPYGLPPSARDVPSSLFALVIDLVAGPVGDRADVLLPASSLAESSGTITCLDGRVLPTFAARRPVGGKSLFQTLGALADAMGASIPLAKPEQVWDELSRLQPGLEAYAASRLDLAGKMWAG